MSASKTSVPTGLIHRMRIVSPHLDVQKTVPIPAHLLAGENDSCRRRLLNDQRAGEGRIERQQVAFVYERFVEAELVEIHPPPALER